MSQPPPYGSGGYRPENPDKRALPQGWIERYDENYRTWFYVYTLENPPRSSWVHPLGPPPPAPSPGGYAPPAGPPPPSGSPYPPPGGYNPGYNQPPPQQQWGQSPPPPSGYYGSPPPPQGGYSNYPPAQESRGWFGSNSPQPTTVVQQQAPPKKSGMGIGTAVLAGGAGLVGGALLMDAFEDHEDHEREEAYDSGYNQGYDQGYDQGDNFDGGGGDW